jgi:hypothetical protein
VLERLPEQWQLFFGELTFRHRYQQLNMESCGTGSFGVESQFCDCPLRFEPSREDPARGFLISR